MDVWDLIGCQGEPPSTVEIAVDGGIPSLLPPVLTKLRKCGLDTGYVLLALIAEHTLDPWGVWEILWQEPTEFPLLRLRDEKPHLLFIQNLGFFPFGEELPSMDSGRQYVATEGILVVDLRSSGMVFLRQTSTMGPEQSPPEARKIIQAAQNHFNGKYHLAWAVDQATLEQQLKPVRAAVDRAAGPYWNGEGFLEQFVKQQILGGMQHTISQWELEKEELQEGATVTDIPPEIAAATAALSAAQEEDPQDVVVPPGENH